MAGSKKGRRIQIGQEATAGTAVAATAIWLGTGLPEDKRTLVFRNDDVGYASGVDQTYTPQLLAALPFEETNATFEQLPYIFAAGIKGVVEGIADGVGTGKIYAYPLPTTAPNTNVLKTFTLEGGDEQQCEEIEYGFVPDFKITGQPGAALRVSSSWQGRQSTPVSFTALSLPSVAETIKFLTGKLYIDDVPGTIGTTLKSGTFIGLDISVNTGWYADFSANGDLFFYQVLHSGEKMEVTANITFEHDAIATAEKAKWRAEASRLVRLEWSGSTLATPGTSFTKKTFRTDLAGKWERFEKIGERNGNDIISGMFRARYNSTADLFSVFTVVNSLATLP
jgi:hypothetical protein